jgi:hypothetical protein
LLYAAYLLSLGEENTWPRSLAELADNGSLVDVTMSIDNLIITIPSEPDSGVILRRYSNSEVRYSVEGFPIGIEINPMLNPSKTFWREKFVEDLGASRVPKKDLITYYINETLLGGGHPGLLGRFIHGSLQDSLFKETRAVFWPPGWEVYIDSDIPYIGVDTLPEILRIKVGFAEERPKYDSLRRVELGADNITFLVPDNTYITLHRGSSFSYSVTGQDANLDYDFEINMSPRLSLTNLNYSREGLAESINQTVCWDTCGDGSQIQNDDVINFNITKTLLGGGYPGLLGTLSLARHFADGSVGPAVYITKAIFWPPGWEAHFTGVTGKDESTIKYIEIGFKDNASS